MNNGLLGFPRNAAFPSHFTQRRGVARPWVSKLREITFSVADYGGSPNKDNSNAIARAYAAVERRGGGVLSFPAGTWPFRDFPVIETAGTIVRGEGRGNFNGTVLQPMRTTGDDIVLTGQACVIEDLAIRPRVRKTAGYAIKFAAGSFFSGFSRIWIFHGWNGIFCEDAGETRGDDVHFRHLLGTNGLTYAGTDGNGSFGATFDKIVADNPYPQAYGTVKAWATTTAFSLNDIVAVNGNVYQCSTAGTSAGGGDGPSGLPSGSTAQDAFTNTITDGTAQWKFVCSSLVWMTVENFGYSARFNNCGLINGVIGFLMSDTADDGASSRPKWVWHNNLEVDHPFNNGVQLDIGAGFDAVNSWWGSSLNTRGLEIGGDFIGNVSVRNTRIATNHLDGVLLNAGPTNVLLSGNRVQHNSQAGAESFHGIAVGANATDFVIQGNQSGPDPDIGGGNPQGFGIIINTGSSDRYIVADNLVGGNETGGIADGGSGGNKRVENNY